MEKPIMIFRKNSEAGSNKIRLPKAVVEKTGNKFYMEIYEDKIILIPVKKEK